MVVSGWNHFLAARTPCRVQTFEIVLSQDVWGALMAKKRVPVQTGEDRPRANLNSDIADDRMHPELRVLAQYIRDLSFECPGAPAVLRSSGKNSRLQVDMNVKVTPGREDSHEVLLKCEAHTKNDKGVIFHLDVAYGGLFRLRNIPDKQHDATLWISCPTLLFPFLRRLVADLTADAGFPPLFLQPIDFANLYAKKLTGARERGETELTTQ